MIKEAQALMDRSKQFQKEKAKKERMMFLQNQWKQRAMLDEQIKEAWDKYWLIDSLDEYKWRKGYLRAWGSQWTVNRVDAIRLKRQCAFDSKKWAVKKEAQVEPVGGGESKERNGR